MDAMLDQTAFAPLAAPTTAQAPPTGAASPRAARMSEVDAALRLLAQLFPADPTLPDRAELARLAGAGDAYFSVPVVSGEPAGVLVLRDQPFRPWTNGAFLGVAPGHRGLRLGGALMRHALAVSRRPLFRLCVREANGRARRIYEAEGMRVWSRRADPAGDTLVMIGRTRARA